MNLKPCYFCGRAGQLQCGGCGEVSACCSAHLKLHRRGEEPCFPWEILEKPVVGRCMVTSRKVCAGETLFQEEPVVIGPNQVGSPICLSCYSSIDLQYRCTSCQYPLCGPDCQTSSVHAEECIVLRRGNPPVFQDENTEAYHCILPLRLVLLSRTNPEIFNLTDRLMDHEEERSQGEDWQITERTVVKNILEICKGEEIEKFTIQEVRRAVGVLEVNSYEVHSFVRCGYRGCFPAASLLSHGCVANSRHIWSTVPPYTNTCIATVDLEKGEEIITSYHLPTTCSILRRSKLLEGWYFECNCRRCESADELGTHLNTQICKGCGSPSLLPTTPLQIGSDWVCQNSECRYRTSGIDTLKTATDLVNHIKTISKSDRYNIQLWLDILDKAESQVHPQHEAVIEICKWLLPIFCRGPNTRTQDYALNLLQRKIELAKRQTKVLNVIEPGISKTRAKALYELLETEIYLLVSYPQLCGEFKMNPENQENLDISIPFHQGLVSDRIDEWMTTCQDILRIFDRLGSNPGFETILCTASTNILKRCSCLRTELKTGNVGEQWNKFKLGWSLLELWKYDG